MQLLLKVSGNIYNFLIQLFAFFTENNSDNDTDNDTIIKFSEDPNLSNEECMDLLKSYAHDLYERKITLRLFVKYVITTCINI